MDFMQLASQAPFFTVSANFVRIGNSRVPLETVVSAFKYGSTCEEIVFQFPTLDLGDVYAAIGFFLKNREAVETWLILNEKETARHQRQILAKFPPNGLRQRLRQRQMATKPALV